MTHDVGGETEPRYIAGVYSSEEFDTFTARWFGGGSKTVILFPSIPDSGSVTLQGRAADEMSVQVVVEGEVRGQTQVMPEVDTYRIQIN